MKLKLHVSIFLIGFRNYEFLIAVIKTQEEIPLPLQIVSRLAFGMFTLHSILCMYC